MYFVQYCWCAIVTTTFNRARRAAKEALEKEAANQANLPAPAKPRVKLRHFVKIGRPGYKVTKQKDVKSDQHSLLFQVNFIFHFLEPFCLSFLLFLSLSSYLPISLSFSIFLDYSLALSL